MKFRVASLLVSILMLLTAFASAWAMTGEEIMREQERRHKVKSEYAEEVMLLVDKKGNKEKRFVTRHAKDVGDGLNRALMVFQLPAGIRGTALLTWEQDDRDDDQWLWMPAQKRMQRIAQGSKKSYFMGTDFTYEDMEPEDIDNFTYAILRNEAVDGQDCWVIEAVPANDVKRKASGYSKRHMWITTDTFVTLKVDFYDPRGRLLKTQTSHDLEHMGGTVWRAKKTLMDNHKKKHKTVTGVKSRQIDVDIEDSVFTERHISTGRHLK